MKIVHIATNDIQGGAARAAYRLHAGLQEIGVDSEMFVEHKASADSTVYQYQAPRDLRTRIRRRFRSERISRDYHRYCRTRPQGLEIFSDSRSRFQESFEEFQRKSNIVNLHWIASFVDYTKFFSSLPQGKPVVWTLHDMSALTGGCHYVNGCRRFETECVTCPQLGSVRTRDLANKIWKDKSNAYKHLNDSQLHIVTPSKWLGEEAAGSALLQRFGRSVIPNGIDVSLFSPRDASGLRNALGIPVSAKVVGFVSDSTGNPRKGLSILLEALDELNDNNTYLVSIGHGKPLLGVHMNHIHLGSIHVDGMLSLAYSLFDVFCCPTLEDNLPNTVIESLACGTPVVGFNVGGMPDMVISGETGILVEQKDSHSLKIALENILNDDQRLAPMSAKCREYAVRKFSLQIQAKDYKVLYENLLK